jgi:hypothetical protein
LVGRARVVALTALADTVRSAMLSSSLHMYASRQPGAQAFEGRGTAWSTALPNGFEVVVRHSRHGGMLGNITGDLFLSPTRAPRELAVALSLENAGVPTPVVIAYAVYPAMGPFARSDVATRTLRGADFPAAWRAATNPSARLALVALVANLLRALRRAGAYHPDLNLKNIFIRETPNNAPVAYVLDVDRIEFGTPGSEDVSAKNLKRLVQSARKWRATRGLDIDEFTDLGPLADAIGVNLEATKQ